MGSVEERPDRPKPYRARYWGLDGKQHRQSFKSKKAAENWLKQQEASKLDNSWVDPTQSRRRFDDWADEWWQVWSSKPGRSPATLQTAESHLRLHVRPFFGKRQLGSITVHLVQRWQNELETTSGSYNLTMACRSILNRILQGAEDERAIPANPVRRVRAPRRPVDPEEIFGRVTRRTFTPEEFATFLGVCTPFYRDHFLTQVGTGLRSGELLGLHAFRVDMIRGRLEILDVRYDAGKFGSGYKDRPKSESSIRPVPMAPSVRAAVRRLLLGCPKGDLVFCGPGGSNGVMRGERSKLSVGNYRRVYHAALTEKTRGADGESIERPRFPDLELHGPHDLRHTFATWLEDGGIPPRVIDEFMGHNDSRRGTQEGSRIGIKYRHLTDKMVARVLDVIEECLAPSLRHIPIQPEEGSPSF